MSTVRRGNRGGTRVMFFGGPMRKRPEQTPREQVQTVLGSLRQMVPLLWRLAPGLLLAEAVLTLLQAAVPTVGIFVTKALGDAAAKVISAGPAYLGTAYRLLVIQLALALVSAGLGALNTLVRSYVQRQSSFHIDGLVTAKSARLPLTFFDQPDYYDQLQRIMGSGQRSLGVIDAGLQVLQNLLTALGILLILMRFHWILALGMLVLAAPTLIANIRMGERRFWQMRMQSPIFRKVNYLQQLLRGREPAKEIRIFGLLEYLTRRWSELFWQTAREQMGLERRAAWFRLGTEGLAGLAGAATLGFLLWLGAQGRLTIGDYVALAQAIVSARGLMQSVANGLANIYENALFTSDLFSFLALPEEARPADPRPFPVPLRQGITLEGVTFAYPGNRRPVLAEISLHIAPGEKVAIVGENGAGKTTLVKCLMGLYFPAQGRVAFDGIDVRNLDPADVRKHVTAIFQDFVQYQLTVRENIGFGRINQLMDDAGLGAAAARGGADEVLASLPKGYDTELGPTFLGGHELSHGQWQKIALSRAFFRDADVIVLDEPTAALDPRAEAAVFDRFARLAKGKTALLISHRLGTCRSADRILVLREGRLVEEGSHEALMARDGEYARMFRLQAQWYI